MLGSEPSLGERNMSTKCARGLTAGKLDPRGEKDALLDMTPRAKAAAFTESTPERLALSAT